MNTTTVIRHFLGAFLLFGTMVWGAASGTLSVRAADDQTPILKRELYSIVKNAKIDEKTKVGVYIKVLENGRVVFSSDGNTPLVPASNLKIMTTAAALSMLGPNYRLKTELRGPLPNSNGQIEGNLYLRGDGDPTTTPPYDQPCTSPYSKFIANLKAAQVREITGDLVADDSAFDRNFLPEGWLEHYRLDAFSAPVGGLSLNGNLIEVVVSPLGCYLEPACSTMSIESQYSNSYDTAVERPKGSNIVKVLGGTPSGEIRRQICVENPPLFSIGVFKKLLDKENIVVRGKVRLIEPSGEAALVNNLPRYGLHLSLPISTIIQETNHESDNLFAEHLYRSIGQLTSGQGSAESGMQACRQFLEANNINSSGLKMVDGCGLSAKNRISPNQLASVLDAMDRSYYRSWYKESLPHSGRGTLRGRLGDVELRAKTGTLDHDSSLTGYIITAAGQELVFSVIVNDAPIWIAVDTQNKIAQTLGSWDRRL
ncbi:MAG: D-alanyl-D-alanine carboxypeptidase/D-alanyl-D-alanine-endopeptidase [Candidatus Bruticola sp.]